MTSRIISGLALLAILIVSLPSAIVSAEQARVPLKIAVVSSGDGKDGGLAKLKTYLETTYNVQVVLISAPALGGAFDKEGTTAPFRIGKDSLDNEMKPLQEADVILSAMYRTAAPAEQLKTLKHCFLTKPVVGLRRAHHGFQNWPEADREVFGIHYKGHQGGMNFRAVEAQKNHPVITGFEPIEPDGGYYAHQSPAEDVTPLLIMTTKDGKTEVPQTWFRVNKETGRRAFYTRYGPDSVGIPAVRDLVVRALFWAANRDPQTLKK